MNDNEPIKGERKSYAFTFNVKVKQFLESAYTPEHTEELALEYVREATENPDAELLEFREVTEEEVRMLAEDYELPETPETIN